jgi:hypothetical protein
LKFTPAPQRRRQLTTNTLNPCDFLQHFRPPSARAPPRPISLPTPAHAAAACSLEAADSRARRSPAEADIVNNAPSVSPAPPSRRALWLTCQSGSNCTCRTQALVFSTVWNSIADRQHRAINASRPKPTSDQRLDALERVGASRNFRFSVSVFYPDPAAARRAPPSTPNTWRSLRHRFEDSIAVTGLSSPLRSEKSLSTLRRRRWTPQFSPAFGPPSPAA